MSQFTEAMHDFVQASGDYTAVVRGRSTGAQEEQYAGDLAAAGDRLESILREMTHEEASRAVEHRP